MDADRQHRTRADEQRFRALFASAYPALCRYAYHRGLTRADADDLVAEVLTIAWRRLDAVPVDDPTPWLFAVARNVWRNHLRSAARRDAFAARVPDRNLAYPTDMASFPTVDEIGRAMAAASNRQISIESDDRRRRCPMDRATRASNALELCRAARPEVPDDLLSPHGPAAQALLEEILSMPIETQPAETQPARTRETPLRPRRARPVIAIAASAGVAALLAIVVVNAGGPRPALANIARVAETSNAALDGSGRAHVTFDLQTGTPFAQQGTNEVAWSGRDIEMKVHIEAHDDRPESDAWTKTVDGESYSFVGPKGQEGHWVHDTDASGTNGRQLFDADPRTLLSILDPAARFTDVGTERIDGVETRHLHATAVDELPVVNLGLAPDARNTSVTSLDVWVGADDVVRRLDLALRRTDTKTAGGQPTASVSFDSTYSVTFTDLGAAIAITAPADAEPAAGKG